MANLCPHWLNYHGRQISDIALWGADWVKVVDPDPEQCARLKNELGVKLVGRISDLCPISYHEYPRLVAQEHWQRIVSHRCAAIVDVWEAANEPGDLLEIVHRRWLADYWTILMDLAEPRGYRIAWGVFSTGAPPGVGNVGVSNWYEWQQVIQRAGSRHPLALHEYWQPGNLTGSIPWHAGRFRFVPGIGPILITECGANRAVNQPDMLDLGWRGAVSEEAYLDELSQYRELISADPRVLAAFVYTYDFGDYRWETFDVSSLSIQIGRLNVSAKPSPVPPKPTPTPAPDPMAEWRALLADVESVCNETDALLFSLWAIETKFRRLVNRG